MAGTLPLGSDVPQDAFVRNAAPDWSLARLTIRQGAGGRPITTASLHRPLDDALAGRLERLTFVDLDRPLVERELARMLEGGRSGPTPRTCSVTWVRSRRDRSERTTRWRPASGSSTTRRGLDPDRPAGRPPRHLPAGLGGCLGTPHLGADLEKGVHVLGWAFGRLPETRALGALLDARSTGIKDLRYGACVEEDWRGHDPDEFLPATDVQAAVPAMTSSSCRQGPR